MKIPHLLACAVILAAQFVQPAFAQPMILDQEFTDAATTLTAPLRASLSPQTSVHYVLINDPSINAFVTQENIIYVHSGLIEKARSAAELQGVLAHELGHIAANHLLQQEVFGKQATAGAIAGAVLGIGAAAVGAPAQAAGAIMMGSQAGAIQSFMAHTRTQEAEADRRAINALHTAGLSAQGMVDMFNTLRTESQLSYDAPPPWLVTHPLPPERLANLTQAIQSEDAALKTGLTKTEKSVNFTRLQAKVMALTATPGAVLRKYNGADDASRYARALAYYRQGKLDFFHSNMAPLLKANPDDPYYNELMGKLALDSGDLGTANRIYTKLAAANPNAAIFNYQLAEILRNQSDFTGAIAYYQRVTRSWPEWADPWMGLGLCYGNLGRITESHLARTQAFIVAPDYEAAKQSLALARTYLKKSPDPKLEDWATALQTRLDNLKP